MQLSILERHRIAGTDNIHVVRLDLHSVVHLQDLHRRVTRQDLRDDALPVWRQMLHENESQAAVGAHDFEKLTEGFQSARGCTDANDREGESRWLVEAKGLGQ